MSDDKTLFKIKLPREKHEFLKEASIAITILVFFFGILALVLFDRKTSCKLYAPDLEFGECLSRGKWKQENVGK